jgi:hypothetical protein
MPASAYAAMDTRCCPDTSTGSRRAVSMQVHQGRQDEGIAAASQSSTLDVCIDETERVGG